MDGGLPDRGYQPISEEVLEVLTESQRLGFLGERSILEAAEHSRGFVRGLSGVSGVVVDIGAGGGLPGFVLGHDRPDLQLLLVDRRAKRTDFLRRMVRRLGWVDHMTVQEADVLHLITERPGAFDGVVARGFGPPEETLSLAAELMGPSGRIVISEPPAGDRWESTFLERLGLTRIDDRSDSVAVFESLRAPDVSRET